MQSPPKRDRRGQIQFCGCLLSREGEVYCCGNYKVLLYPSGRQEPRVLSAYAGERPDRKSCAGLARPLTCDRVSSPCTETLLRTLLPPPGHCNTVQPTPPARVTYPLRRGCQARSANRCTLSEEPGHACFLDQTVGSLVPWVPVIPKH